jgi:hypothetical protein
MHCAEANGKAACTDGARCDPKSSSRNCAGNRFVSCDPATGLQATEDCSRSGIVNANCRVDGSSAGCYPSGRHCSSDRCDGDVAVVCLAGEEGRAVRSTRRVARSVARARIRRTS